MNQFQMDKFKMIQRAYTLLDEITPAIKELSQLRCRLYYDEDDTIGDFRIDMMRIQDELEKEAEKLKEMVEPVEDDPDADPMMYY